MDETNINTNKIGRESTNDNRVNAKDKISKPIDFIAKRYFKIYKALKEKYDNGSIDDEYFFELDKEKYYNINPITRDEEKIELEIYTIFRFIYKIVPSNEENHKLALQIYNLLLKLKEKNDWKKHDINRIKDEINMIYILCDKNPPFLQRIYDRCCYVIFNNNDKNRKMR